MVLTLVFLDPRAGVVRGVVVPILAVDAVALALFGFLFLRRGIRIIVASPFGRCRRSRPFDCPWIHWLCVASFLLQSVLPNETTRWFSSAPSAGRP